MTAVLPRGPSPGRHGAVLAAREDAVYRGSADARELVYRILGNPGVNSGADPLVTATADRSPLDQRQFGFLPPDHCIPIDHVRNDTPVVSCDAISSAARAASITWRARSPADGIGRVYTRSVIDAAPRPAPP
jgi:hypothetical protein